jgi:hypothetical protein
MVSLTHSTSSHVNQKLYAVGEQATAPLSARWCGSTHPFSITSSTDSLFIRFKTDTTFELRGANMSFVDYGRSCALTLTVFLEHCVTIISTFVLWCFGHLPKTESIRGRRQCFSPDPCVTISENTVATDYAIDVQNHRSVLRDGRLRLRATTATNCGRRVRRSRGWRRNGCACTIAAIC